MKHIVYKVVAIVSILSLLLGLFGCGGNKKYTIDDIVLVHTGYYGMESNPVYSFAMRKEEDNWVFSASCRVGSNKDHYTSFSSFPITDEDAQGFLQIIREDGEIERLFKYRNPIRIFHISDAPARSFGMTFSDGNSVEKETRLGDRALDYLYALADRHYKSAESVEVTAVSIHRNCMDYSSSCSFCLEKNEGVWLFSFDAEIDRSGGHTEAENQRIEEDVAEEILRIVKERQLVTRVKQYEVPPDDDIFALDETTYWTSFEFADGSSIDAPIDAGAELIDAFYSLAKIKIHQR
jgi:lipoprotein